MNNTQFDSNSVVIRSSTHNDPYRSMNNESSPLDNNNYPEIIYDDDEFYHSISNIYQLANEPALEILLESKLDSILKQDPFYNKISIDFGFGPLGSLSDYQIDKTQISYWDTFNIDDLYLFEMRLMADERLSERDKLRNWSFRLNWENVSGRERKIEIWKRMTKEEKARIGIEVGTWWTKRLFNSNLNSKFITFKLKNKIKVHFPLIGETKSRFPFWRDAGLGLGRSLKFWLIQNKSEFIKFKNDEILIRSLISQRRASNMIDHLMASTLGIHPSQLPNHHHQQKPYHLNPNLKLIKTSIYPLSKVNQFYNQANLNPNITKNENNNQIEISNKTKKIKFKQ